MPATLTPTRSGSTETPRSTSIRVIGVNVFWLGVLLIFSSIPNGLRRPIRILGLLAPGWLVFADKRALRFARLALKKTVLILIGILPGPLVIEQFSHSIHRLYASLLKHPRSKHHAILESLDQLFAAS